MRFTDLNGEKQNEDPDQRRRMVIYLSNHRIFRCSNLMDQTIDHGQLLLRLGGDTIVSFIEILQWTPDTPVIEHSPIRASRARRTYNSSGSAMLGKLSFPKLLNGISSITCQSSRTRTDGSRCFACCYNRRRWAKRTTKKNERLHVDGDQHDFRIAFAIYAFVAFDPWEARQVQLRSNKKSGLTFRDFSSFLISSVFQRRLFASGQSGHSASVDCGIASINKMVDHHHHHCGMMFIVLRSVENAFVSDRQVSVNAWNPPVEMYSHHLRECTDTCPHPHRIAIDIYLDERDMLQTGAFSMFDHYCSFVCHCRSILSNQRPRERERGCWANEELYVYICHTLPNWSLFE